MSRLLANHVTRTAHFTSADTERSSPCVHPIVSRPLRVNGLRFRRGDEAFRVQGVTYGPFAPGNHGTQFPLAKRVGDDFGKMTLAGINSIRVYHPPPAWLLELADEYGLSVLIDIP